MLKSKIHNARVTGADLHYEGSILIDQQILEMSGMVEFEKVDIWNKTNAQRFSTYTIAAKPGSGTILVNGAAARLVSVGDELIIASFGLMTSEEIKQYSPKIVILNEQNTAKLKDPSV